MIVPQKRKNKNYKKKKSRLRENKEMVTTKTPWFPMGKEREGDGWNPGGVYGECLRYHSFSTF